MLRRSLPPPERLTTLDILHIALGALMVPLGVLIIVRTFAIAPTVPGILVGGAMLSLGIHRLYLAGSRLWLLRQKRRGKSR
ncbi:MAG: hypothetical protein ACP5OO_03045 [Chloroflexia bacterium]